MLRRVLAVVVSGALLTGGLGSPVSGAQVSGGSPAPAKAAEPLVVSRPDRLAASLTAAVQGSAVEVESSRSQSVREWANPDGSVTVDAYTGPNWVADEDGGWAEVDTTLVADGQGGFTTTASPLEVTVGGSGAKVGSTSVAQDGSAADPAVLVSLGSLDVLDPDARPSQEVSVGWAGDLPAPQVSGSVATFADVARDVDVRVKV